MEKILFAPINARFTHSNLAIFYLKKSIEDLNFQKEILDLTINEQIEDILSLIYSKKPDYLVLSVYIWNSEIIKKILSSIKKILPDCTIIVGGPEVSFNSEKWIEEFPQIDKLFIGNGDKEFRNYLLKKTKPKITKSANFNFSEVKFPYSKEELKKMSKKYIYYESSRGCAFKCSYCLSSRLDQKYDPKPINKVIEELQVIISQKPRIVKFVDRTFNFEPKRAQKIWSFLIDSKTETKFHFEIHPSFLTDQDFEILKKAKKDAFQFEIGIQSTNIKTLKEINRTPNWEIQEKKIKKLISLKKFHIHVDLITGLPYEDFASFKNSFNDIFSLEADHFQVGFLKVLPGTLMLENKNKYNLEYNEFPPYQILRNKWITFEELELIKIIDYLVKNLNNSGDFKISLKNSLSLFSSPIDFFEEFALYLKNEDKTISNKWKKIANLLLEFISLKRKDNYDFILDSLRWDWLKKAVSHHYPPEISIANEKELRYQKKILANHISKKNLENLPFNRQELNKAILFKCISKKLKKSLKLDDYTLSYKKNNIISLFSFSKKSLDNLL